MGQDRLSAPSAPLRSAHDPRRSPRALKLGESCDTRGLFRPRDDWQRGLSSRRPDCYAKGWAGFAQWRRRAAGVPQSSRRRSLRSTAADSPRGVRWQCANGLLHGWFWHTLCRLCCVVRAPMFYVFMFLDDRATLPLVAAAFSLCLSVAMPSHTGGRHAHRPVATGCRSLGSA
jgi:hypothetical protein